MPRLPPKPLAIVTLLLVSAVNCYAWTNTDLPYQEGPYKPNWKSLSAQYQTPDWFKDAKFGIWAHWGIQCTPGSGDWSGLFLYGPTKEGNEWFNGRSKQCHEFHQKHYGHPSEIGMKDYIPGFTASEWDPDALLELYKRAGARYFVAMANHHDNFDNWNSKHQPWNSVNMGPKRDLIKEWAKAAEKHKLKFGVSVHAARAWDWIAPIFSHDTEGPMQGVPYDSFMTKADGAGKWWEGYDPAELYTRPHTKSDPMDQDYVNRFYLRTLDLIDQHKPDLLYFDDGKSPLGNTGLRIYAHFYNSSLLWNENSMDVVINSKHNDELTRKAVVEDVERGAKSEIFPTTWQTDTCVGGWHYNLDFVNGIRSYKTAGEVIRTLVDIVSKNGNLLLSIPLKANGTPDANCISFLEEIAAWMDVNAQGIYGTRPWHRFGEGPTNTVGGHTSEQALVYTQEDFRFTTKGDTLYIFAMANAQDNLLIQSLTKDKKLVSSVELVGSQEPIQWRQTDDGLSIKAPKSIPVKYVTCYRIN
ncbi:MAG: alpha-L-fucosidase [Lentimonas sp.]